MNSKMMAAALALAGISPHGRALASSSGGEKQYIVSGLNPAGDNWLALKTAPTLRAARIAKLPPDTRVTVIGESGDWYHVVLTSGVQGWVVKRYALPQRTAVPAENV